jgi:hypothetical protein
MQITRQESERKPVLTWRRDGSDWRLLAGRRRLGRVVPDHTRPGMWRPVLSGGRLGDLANLSWAKVTVLDAAVREIEPLRQAATAPSKSQQNGAVFEGSASPTRSSNVAGTTPAVMP